MTISARRGGRRGDETGRWSWQGQRPAGPANGSEIVTGTPTSRKRAGWEVRPHRAGGHRLGPAEWSGPGAASLLLLGKHENWVLGGDPPQLLVR